MRVQLFWRTSFTRAPRQPRHSQRTWRSVQSGRCEELATSPPKGFEEIGMIYSLFLFKTAATAGRKKRRCGQLTKLPNTSSPFTGRVKFSKLADFGTYLPTYLHSETPCLGLKFCNFFDANFAFLVVSRYYLLGQGGEFPPPSPLWIRPWII